MHLCISPSYRHEDFVARCFCHSRINNCILESIWFLFSEQIYKKKHESGLSKLHAILAQAQYNEIPRALTSRTLEPENVGVQGAWQPFGREMCVINVDSRGYNGHILNTSIPAGHIIHNTEYYTMGAIRSFMYGTCSFWCKHVLLRVSNQAAYVKRNNFLFEYSNSTWVLLPFCNCTYTWRIAHHLD